MKITVEHKISDDPKYCNKPELNGKQRKCGYLSELNNICGLFLEQLIDTQQHNQTFLSWGHFLKCKQCLNAINKQKEIK